MQKYKGYKDKQTPTYCLAHVWYVYKMTIVKSIQP